MRLCVYVSVLWRIAGLSTIKLIVVTHSKFQWKLIDCYVSNPPMVFIQLQCIETVRVTTDFEHVFPFWMTPDGWIF